MDADLFERLHRSKSHDKTEEMAKDGKTSSEEAMDKSIQIEIDRLMSEQNQNENQLLSIENRRQKLEMEIKEALDCSELSQHVTDALVILQEEGTNYLEKESYDVLMEEIEQLISRLGSNDNSCLSDEEMEVSLAVSSNGLASILLVGVAKFNEGCFTESLSILSFLSVLDSKEPDYLYRLGIVAEQCEQYQLALRAYLAVENLIPNFIGPHIFAAQCYLKINEKDKATAELGLAKDILKNKEADATWQDHVNEIESLIAQTDKGGNI